jgi:hypothetical protein
LGGGQAASNIIPAGRNYITGGLTPSPDAPEIEDALVPVSTESSEEWAQASSVQIEGKARRQDEGLASAAPSDLPPLEELVQRIPAELRATLDELFRARFTRATRAAPKEVQTPS